MTAYGEVAGWGGARAVVDLCGARAAAVRRKDGLRHQQGRPTRRHAVMAEGEAAAAHLSLHRPGAGYGRAERGYRDADMVPGRPGAAEDRTQPNGAAENEEA